MSSTLLDKLPDFFLTQFLHLQNEDDASQWEKHETVLAKPSTVLAHKKHAVTLGVLTVS